MLALSFICMILLGTIGFLLIPGLCTDERLGFIDSLFTATSAICITGLVAADTGTTFTFWGQLYLLILIQLGGLGILTLASAIISSIGLRPSLKTEIAVANTGSTLPFLPSRKLIRDIVGFTLLFETLGAVSLYVTWAPTLGWREAIWPSIFHSVSAFCNAGFSLNHDSLMGFADSPATLTIVSLLVICGGIGFITLEEVFLWMRAKKKRDHFRISIHSKVVLYGTVLCLVIPSVIFGIFEWNQSFDGWTLTDKFTNSFFLSATCRTAGFNTIDYGTASDSTVLFTMVLMMIGGAPASLAGGMKITTFMLLGLLAWSKIRGRSTVDFGNRTIPDNTVQRATSIFVIMTTLMILALFGLQFFDAPRGQDGQILARMFEVVSAMNTVGLSMGFTDTLSGTAKVILVIMMFVGRIGPLALLTAFESRYRSAPSGVRFAQEDVLIG
jgi:trk system potassium uptake protein